MSAAGPPARCPLCDLDPAIAHVLQQRWLVWQCPACHLAWWNWPQFDPATLYDRDYFQSSAVNQGYNDYKALEPGVRRTARTRLARIAACGSRRPQRADATESRRPRGADATGRPKLFELGCGTGVFLDEARGAGWDVSGCEVSEYAAACARQRGLIVTTEAAGDVQLAPESLDAVVLWDVIEHLPDPFNTIAQASQALRRGGVLALSTGDVDSIAARLSGPGWHLFNLPEHLFFFSRTSLVRLLEKNGLRIVRCAYEAQWVPISYLAERVFKTMLSKPGPNKGSHEQTTADRSQPMPMWKRFTVPATLWDVLGVYAVRA